MSEQDILSGLKVDEILDDVKRRKANTERRVWSMDEIDALLSSDAPESHAEPVQAQPEPKPAPEPKPEPKPEPAPEPKPEPKPEPAPQPDLPAQKPAAPHTPSLKELARRKAHMEAAEEPASDADIEPLLAGATPQAEPAPAREQAGAPAALPGQISIEKTRVFNEVEAHAVRRSDVEHQIGRRVTHTTGKRPDPIGAHGQGLEADPVRDRFLNRPQQNLEKTQEHRELLAKRPPQTIEKPGVIVRKAEAQNADGELQAIPTLVTPEDVLRAQQAESAEAGAPREPEKEPLEDQIRLAGYETEEEPVEQIDESEAEAKLRERQYARAKDFRLFRGMFDENGAAEPDAASPAPQADGRTRVVPELPDENEPEEEASEPEEAPEPRRRARKRTHEAPPVRVLREFYGPKDEDAVLELYLAEKRGYTLRLWLSVVFLAASAVSALLVQLTGGFSLFGGSAGVYAALHAVLLAAALLLCIPQWKTAFSALRCRSVSAEGGLLAALLAALVQTAAAFAYPESLTSVPLYSALAFWSLTVYFAGRRKGVQTDIDDFRLLAARYGRFSSVARIEDPDTAFEIGRGLLLGDPDVRYSKKLAFPSDFVRVSKRNDRDLGVYSAALPAVLAAAVVIGAVTGFVRGTVFAGISAAAATVLAGLPAAAVAGAASAFSAVNRRLRSSHAMIASFDAAFDAVTANAVVLDAAELFDGCNCRVCGMKTYHKMRVDEALLYTAAMTIGSGGTLSDVFDAVVLGKREILPPVESLAYEERLGCSGWIYNQRVLVGSRELLLKHNVDAPSREEEQRFKKDGCEVLYLAVEGKTAALFVVEYASDRQISAYLQRLEKYGVTILLRTSDPNITETLVEQYFRLPHNLVKVIGPVAGELFRELKDAPPREEPCAVLHDGTTASALRAFLASFALEEKHRLLQVLLYIGVGLGVLLMAALGFFTGLRQAGVLELLLFEGFWTAVVTLVPRFKKV